ncbi:MAG: oligopeptide transport system substrate-binding protein [Planctomycetota bacterium]|jgi:oligopeptide transport system substrate-binding protein
MSTPTQPKMRALVLFGALFLSLLSSCGGQAKADDAGLKVFNYPIRSAGPGSMDPIRGSTTYDNQACSMVYETLLQYKYLKRPLELEPLLCEAMPEVSEDGLVYTFKLKKGVMFHDDPCFTGGKGREMTAEDVVYSWKRIADKDIGTKNWWLVTDTIAGFDAWRDQQNENGFDYDAPCEGLLALDRYTLQVTLAEPVTRFLYVLAMFQTSVVAREAVEEYGSKISRHPVGTGPYTMHEDDWQTSKSLDFYRNKNYREEYYPSEWMPEDEVRGLHEDAGRLLPICDKVHISCYVQDQPMWLEFRIGRLDYAQIPAENYLKAIRKRTRTLTKEFRDEGITYHPVPLLDFIFRGFNMTDPLVGGDSEKNRKLRQAISLACDFDEFNATFYNNQNIVYDGMIPPALGGHPEGGLCDAAYKGPDIPRARKLLAEAGYPDGEGLPVIDYYTSLAANSAEQAEMTKRQLNKIGVRVNPILLEFPQLIEAINKKKAPLFSFAWGSDYPDGENNLALFYGPNGSPGANHYNYTNAEYDLLYEKIRTMPPSPERTKIYETMRDMVLEDAPFIGSMARTRNYLGTRWLRNFKPTEDFWNWPKYLDIDEDIRPN